MRITEIRGMGGFYRVFFDAGESGGHWADFDAAWVKTGRTTGTWDVQYIGGNAASDRERRQLEALLVERFETEVAI